MNSKIAMSGLSILASLAVMGGATFAFFSSSGTSSANTFASGSMSLFLDDIDESAADSSVLASLTASGFVPGATTTGHISLNNAGTVPMAEVAMDIDTSETADGDAPSDMRGVLNLSVMVDDTTSDPSCTGGTDVTGVIETAVGDGSAPLTLLEFDNGGVDHYDSFLTGTGLAPAATRNVCFGITFDSGAGNEYQGDAVDATFTFTAHQDASQI